MPDELLDLMRDKLSALEKALILETDAGVKFKLKYEILNLKQQLAGYAPAFSEPAFPSNTTSQPPLNANNLTASTPDEIFISYKWGGESERIVNELDKRLQEKGLTVIRDKRDLGFKGKIKEFMKRIGQGRYVIVVISDKYLKSDNCMFELLEIAQNGDFYDRIFPIVLADADIYKPVKRLAYVKHWENEIQALNEAMKEVSAANLQGFRDEIDLYTKIRERIASLTDVLRNMNTLTPEMHEAGDFEELYQAIENRRSQDR
jgi:hypothetical protein